VFTVRGNRFLLFKTHLHHRRGAHCGSKLQGNPFRTNSVPALPVHTNAGVFSLNTHAHTARRVYRLSCTDAETRTGVQVRQRRIRTSIDRREKKNRHRYTKGQPDADKGQADSWMGARREMPRERRQGHGVLRWSYQLKIAASKWCVKDLAFAGVVL
jgi:hypothetical protein